jgi:hypothetical protein
MKFNRSNLAILVLSLMGLNLACCEKDKNPVHLSNITLWDKPLSVIQDYTTGSWKLEYSYGGFTSHKSLDRINSYMILKPNHIKLGNDSLGVVVDTTIVWVKYDIGTNDFTYLLSFNWSGFPLPEYNVVQEIKNDTLIIREYVNDGYTLYYTKK